MSSPVTFFFCGLKVERMISGRRSAAARSQALREDTPWVPGTREMYSVSDSRTSG